jgi:hypothetical protein
LPPSGAESARVPEWEGVFTYSEGEEASGTVASEFLRKREMEIFGFGNHGIVTIFVRKSDVEKAKVALRSRPSKAIRIWD